MFSAGLVKFMPWKWLGITRYAKAQ